MINIIGVKVGGKYYVSLYDKSKNVAFYYDTYTNLNSYRINDKIPEQSFHKSWSIIDDIPKKIEQKQATQNINYRYELIDKDLVSDKIPLIIDYHDVDRISYDSWIGKYANLQSLYELKNDIKEEEWIPIEFTYETIFETDDIKVPEEINFTKNVKFNELAKLLFPELVLPNSVCSLTTEESYRIIREYVKRNINPKYAAITSDYDFCFTVEKVIELAERESYKINVNGFKKRTKPKYETRYRYDKRIKCFEIAPKAYQSYPVIQPFSANNQKELEEKIQKYLDDLMKEINKPIKYCKCCNGTGVILDEN